MLHDQSESARSLRSPTVRAARLELLQAPHIAPLTQLVEELRRERPDLEFPYFDPLDGGTAADILFLFEKPGPMTAESGRGSGFISRNNDDPTAEATFGFMTEARLPRSRTVIWNVIPGWNGTRKITGDELATGIKDVGRLIRLLPSLRTIVLVGRKAERVRKELQTRGFRVFASAHPSPLVRAGYPERWRMIASCWAQARIHDDVHNS
jgi:hypothetical protein